MTLPQRSLINLSVAVASLAAALGAHKTLTSLMSLHMLVQLPLLVIAGLAAEQAWYSRRRAPTFFERWQVSYTGWSCNDYGLPGLLLVSLIGIGWMIPKALDDALTDWRMTLFKYVGLPVCGWVLGASLRRAPKVITLFFLGNFSWMSAIAGMIYLDLPVRLCNAYLNDDQHWTGRGLIALAVVLPAVWVVAERKTLRSRM